MMTPALRGAILVLRPGRPPPQEGPMQKLKYLAYTVAAVALTLAISGCATSP